VVPSLMMMDTFLLFRCAGRTLRIPVAPVSELTTIVIPCTDQVQFLAPAISSAFEATTKPVEVMVVDHGARGAAEPLVRAFPEVRYIRAPRAGYARARNQGLTNSHGDFILFLDASDRLVPGGLDHSLAALQSHPHCDFVSGRGQRMNDRGVPMTTQYEPVVQRDHYRELLRHNYITRSATVLFRRRAVERAGGFDPWLQEALNYELYLRIARTHPVLDHGRVVAQFRYKRHAGSTARLLRETLEVHRAERELLEGDAESIVACAEGLQASREFYGTRLVNEIRAHMHSRQWAAALAKSVVLGCYHPSALARHARRKATLAVRPARGSNLAAR
jgi:glycosyltransferase involved in cell wall biosynthesis